MWMWRDIDIEYLGRYGIPLPETLQKDISGMSFSETAVYFKETFGIPESLEEIKQIGAGLKAKLSGDELNAEDLDAVAGGVALATVASVVTIIAGGVKIVDFIGKRAGWWK